MGSFRLVSFVLLLFRVSLCATGLTFVHFHSHVFPIHLSLPPALTLALSARPPILDVSADSRPHRIPSLAIGLCKVLQGLHAGHAAGIVAHTRVTHKAPIGALLQPKMGV